MADQRVKAKSLQQKTRTRRWSAAILGFILLVGAVASAFGQDRPDKSVEQGRTPMDDTDLSNEVPQQEVITEKPKRRFPFFDDTKLSAQLRIFYFNRDQFDNSTSEAWTIGGSVSYLSGYLADLLRVGAVVYTSQPLYAPEDRDGTLLLKPGQEGYTVLGQIYGEIKFIEGIFGAVGRKEYNTPYINKNDVRMTPNTFEGVTVYGKTGGKNAPEWRFGGGFISRIKERNSDEFTWMSTDAGASVERGVFLAGANYSWKEFSLGAIDYYSDDVINIAYTETKYGLPLGERNKLRLYAQFSDQRSTGNALLTGQTFSTNQWGVKSDLDLGAAVFTVAYTDTAAGANMRNPWSGYPGYTSVQVQDFNREGESAVMFRASYDFTPHGLKGASAYTLWVHGFGVQPPAFDNDEIDLNLQWTPSKEGSLRGMSFRIRYAYVGQRGGGNPNLNDVRLIMNYDFPRS
jgi:hypothetical protein